MHHQLSPLILIHSHTGQKLCLNVHSDITVGDIKAVIQSLKIQIEDQILLLRNGTKLDEPDKTLGHYGLPDLSDESISPIFIFSRAIRNNPSQTMYQSIVDLIEKPMAPLPTSLATYLSLPTAELDHASSSSAPLPPIAILPSKISQEATAVISKLTLYESKFKSDVALAKEQWEACIERLSTSKVILSELDSQGQAIDAARAGLEVGLQTLSSSCFCFLKRFTEQHRIHQDLLDSHCHDLDTLAQIKVHPDLQNALTKSRAEMLNQGAFSSLSLADILPVSSMKEQQEKCVLNHNRFAKRAAELRNVFSRLKKETHDFLSEAPPFDLHSLLKISLPRAERACDDVSFLVQAFSKDRSIASEAIQSLRRVCMGKETLDAMALKTALDDAQALESIWTSHFEHQSTVLLCGSITLSFLKECGGLKSKVNDALYDQLRTISQFQSKFRDAKLQCVALEEVFKSQTESFNELRMCKRVPSAYRLLLSECMHQANYVKILQSFRIAAQERINSVAFREKERRTEIMKRLSLYLPQDLIALAGLSHTTEQETTTTISKCAEASSLLRVTIHDIPSSFPKLNQEDGVQKSETATDIFADIRPQASSKLLEFFSGQFDQELSDGKDDTHVGSGLLGEIQTCLASKDREIDALKDKIVEQQKRIEDLTMKMSTAANHAFGPIALAAGGMSRPSSPFVSAIDLHLRSSTNESIMIAGDME